MPKEALPPKVAVCIPAYNEAAYLPRCLASLGRALAHPDIPPTQVIVVDNNSTDATPDIIEASGFAECVRESTKGIGAARQTGLLATAPSVEYVLTTDADVIVPDYWIYQHLLALSNPQTSCTYGFAYYQPDSRRPLLNTFLYQLSYLNRAIKTHLLGRHLAGGGNMGFPKAAALKIGGYDPRLARGEDTNLKNKLSLVGNLVRVKAPVLASDRRIQGSGLGKKMIGSLRENLEYYLFNRTTKPNHYADYREQLD